MSKRILLPFLFLCCLQGATAQVDKLFTRELFITVNKSTNQADTLPYRLYHPPLDKVKNLPVILWLHGKGERGRDNEKQLTNGIDILVDSAGKNQTYKAIIIAPQCPPDKFWSTYDKTAAHMQQAIDPTSVELQLIALLNEVIKNYDADPKRIYIMGISMGGFGVWDMITRWPEKFAAAVPICGGGDPSKAGTLKNLPVWAFHGEKDKVINPAFTKEIMLELSNLQPTGMSHLTLYPEVGHNAWDFAIKEPGLLAWLFAQHKP